MSKDADFLYIRKELRSFLKSNLSQCQFGLLRSGANSLVIMMESGYFEVDYTGDVIVVRADKHSKHGYAYIDDLDPAIIKTNKVLSKEGVKVFEKIVKFLKSNFKDQSETVKISFQIYSNYVNIKDTPGSIAKPTEIEHKTAKRPNRRGVVEKVITSLGGLPPKSNNGIVIDKLKNFMERTLGDCNFFVSGNRNVDEISIHLSEGPFEPFVMGYKVTSHVNTLKINGFTHITLDRLDYRFITDIKGKKILSLEATGVFKTIFGFIKSSLKEHTDTNYRLFVMDYKYAGAEPGSISKPTEIEHKTAKRPNRRGVVEAVMSGWGR